MVLGTASSVGKSAIVAGLCRLLSRQGVRVAPFKAQNMSNNAAVCPDGGEIGRAQYEQALAAGVEPTVDMNPILLKPQPGGCQVIVRGKIYAALDAVSFYRQTNEQLWPIVADALDRLRETYDLVVAEGAGSPAEINFRERDIVNMRVARYADASVLLVADIDKGGAFASLLGTCEWLEPEERQLVRGFILNKFRGDAHLLAPAPELLESRTGAPVLGVVPYLDDLGLAEEDSASLHSSAAHGAPIVEIAVVQLPHLSNFDEFGGFAHELGVDLRYVRDPLALRAPDLVVLPGTKATIPDLRWLQATGLADRICWLARHGVPILGVCGGFQMLGRRVRDPLHVESEDDAGVCLGLLPLETELTAEKRLARVNGTFRPGLADVWAPLSCLRVDGYEIHTGVTEASGCAPFLDLDEQVDGAVSGNIAGTYVHGLFERSEPRAALIRELARRRGYAWRLQAPHPRDAFDRLADAIEHGVSLRGLLPATLGGRARV